ncbi:MAG: SCO6880 family protein, partial [Corynebacterium sp.]|nr:SCO6880 family protein [Corynebacterium sp.]
EGVSSVTWEMASAPRSTFEDTLLGNLIAPHARIDRKRVALVYRPYEAGTGASRVEAEHRDAMVAANSSKKIRSAAAEMRLEHTEAARRAQARGAQLGRYSLFVTATTEDEELLGRIRHDVKQLGAQANLRLREMSRQQDAGFITSCGLGQIPWTKESTSALAAQG